MMSKPMRTRNRYNLEYIEMCTLNLQLLTDRTAAVHKHSLNNVDRSPTADMTTDYPNTSFRIRLELFPTYIDSRHILEVALLPA